MQNKVINKISIIGNQIESWMSAIILYRALEGKCEINIIENAELSQPAYFEAGSFFFEIHQRFGINLKPVMQPNQSQLFSATKIKSEQTEKWLGNDIKLAQYKGFELPHILSLLTQTSENLSLAVRVSQAQQLILPQQIPPQLGRYDLSALINGHDYLHFLKQAAHFVGIKSYSAAVKSISCNSENNQIEQLVLADEQVIKTELIINTSAHFQRAFLTQSAQNSTNNPANADNIKDKFISKYTAFAQFKVAMSQTAQFYKTVNCDDCIYHHYDFSGQRIVSVYYDPNAISLQQVHQQILAIYPNAEMICDKASLQLQQFESWRHNCLNLAEIHLDTNPLFAASNLFLRALMRLLELFPNKDFEKNNAALFQQLLMQDLNQYQAYQNLFEFALNRDSEDVQSTNEQTESIQLTEENQQRIALFKSSARLSHELNPLIIREIWSNLLVLATQGHYGFDPVLHALDKTQITHWLNGYKQKLNEIKI
ncbi:tryptophan 7-halogenase [Catenovulum sp. 2E275]|uniref:tryptophan 7-halogenase n=1 Tax=Catenovulum sp. 2E275 TaxID=2980497 RepID=UPI0021D0AFE1|nr:tryptophan 7-halogenase [Catenovulum sp. 2E275]MCU4677244.1 tryptophan 7-halogenase [Catenovulum sp. 2E275]